MAILQYIPKVSARLFSAHKAIGIVVLAVGLSMGIFQLFGEYLQSKIAARASFTLRTLVGQAPKISKDVKVFVLDDPAVAKLDRPYLKMNDWKRVLKSIDSRLPRIIFIDKIFGTNEFSEEGEAAVADFVEFVGSLQSKVVVGAYVSPKLKYRKPLPDEYLERFSQGFWADIYTSGALDSWPGVQLKNQLPYGPHALLLGAFPNVGHIAYFGHGLISPTIRVDSGYTIPHLSLHAALERRVENGVLFLNNQKISVDSRNRMPVNYIQPAEFYKSAYSMTAIFEHAEKGKPVKRIESGDIVVVLPEMYTGSSDFFETAVGLVPGGLVPTSAINSVLTGNYLRKVDFNVLIALAFALLAVLLAQRLPPFALGIAIMGLVTLTCVLGILGFCYLDLMLPWFESSMTLGLAGSFAFMEKLRRFQQRAERLRLTLGQGVSEVRLHDMIHKPNTLVLEPVTRIVSVMFIDIDRFSRIMEKMGAKETFMHLTETMEWLKVTIHAHGGVVDKNLGDGVLAFFGYQYDGESSYTNHADKALSCAIAIQKGLIERSVAKMERADPVFALRIGINSGSVCFGNIGSDQGINVNLVGQSVNYAQRLEAACENYRIMIGAVTWSLLSKRNHLGVGIAQRYIHVKHQENAIEAYEFDPFLEHRTELTKIVAAQRDTIGVERKDARFPVGVEMRLRVENEYGFGRVVDFSEYGLGVELNFYMGRGLISNLTLKSDDAELQKILSDSDIDVVSCECRWGRPTDREGVFLHGLKIRSFTPDQRSKFVKIVSDSLARCEKLVDIA